ncbi:hypothetical protein G4177_12255 [Corallococcus sp. ZKHCc1 1396]|uniref:Lipoprotein SmpA/OmlA domain-containing protein n=1 Tax=Corallococcus soli TaxID=2710757 RepID=A0ABR9PM11_9BACT|nr:MULTISPECIES: hypothetical protein [Corallococcus]MBE4748934.1 hypothetical protein [Corallococcus soli]MCY1032232.1 hypothetical protein [Corallococcus sp. BB11-1]RYZ40121.1 MAG: hypothetical protein EOO72_08735 [Myxococcaceae bacterium]
MRPSLMTAVLALTASGCATTSGFEQLYPGMTPAQVANAMGKGPARAQEFQDGSSAWYFDEDHCVLMRDNVLVAKSTTQTRTAVRTPMGSLKDQDKAFCGPPGSEGDATREQTVHTPFGTFKGTVDPAAVTEQVKNSVRNQKIPPPGMDAPDAGGQATQPTP